MTVHASLIVLRIEVSQVNGDQVAERLRDDFLTLYDHSRAIHAVVDLGGVTYLSSVGIGPLLALNRKVRERGGRLILCAMTEDVEGVFHATKLIGATPGPSAPFEHQCDVPSAVQCLYQGTEGSDVSPR